MSESMLPPPEPSPRPNPRREYRASKPRAILGARWWLPLAFFVSVIVHLFLGANAVHYLSEASREKAVAVSMTSGPVTVEVRPSQEANASPKSKPETEKPDRPKAPDRPKTAEAQPSKPEPLQVQPSPEPTPVALPKETPKVAEKPVPEAPPAEPAPSPQVPAPPATVTPTPRQPRQASSIVPNITPETRTDNITARPAPQPSGSFAPKNLETPLPQGDPSGTPELERAPRPLAASATPSPLPPRTLEKIEGRGGDIGDEPPAKRTVVTTTAPSTGVTLPQPDDGAVGTQANKNRGNGISRGTAMVAGDLGISRGIPFGNKTGIIPNTAALPAEPTPSETTPRSGTASNSAPRFTLSRRSAGGGPPVHIVYVLDISGSMDEDGKIDRTREAMQKALSELQPDDSFNIILFSDEARASYPSLRPASSFYISNGQTQIDLAEPRGATNFSAAIKLAFSQEGATHIFFMSDGEPTEGETDFGRLRSMVRQQNTAHVHVIALALGSGEHFKGMELLKAIAEENDGKFSYINLGKR